MYPKINIVVPFYKNPHLVDLIVRSFVNCLPELQEVVGEIQFYNDSPGDSGLSAALDAIDKSLLEALPIKIINNSSNLGFLQTTNKGMERAIDLKQDILLLNSDAILFPGCLREMRRVAYLDEMIMFVNPRTNNATIATFPHWIEGKDIEPEDAYAYYQAAAHHLPEMQFVPTGIGFCLFIKYAPLLDLGLLDPIYTKGYNEENDLIFRANRLGFRAALANRAFAAHLGNESFSEQKVELERENRKILLERYPEFEPACLAYLAGVDYTAEELISHLVPNESDKLDIVFDLTNIPPSYHGTSILAINVLQAVAQSRDWQAQFALHAIIPKPTYDFLGLKELVNVQFYFEETPKIFAVAIHIGQPFHPDVLVRMSRLAPINCFYMLDTIGWDCQYIFGLSIDHLWRFVFRHANGVIYISEFVATQFHNRFDRHERLVELVSYLSFNPKDYLVKHKWQQNELQPTTQSANGLTSVDSTDDMSKRPELMEVATNILPKMNIGDLNGDHILVIGNHFEHKYLKPTIEGLVDIFPQELFLVIGMGEVAWGSRVKGVLSGDISDELMGQYFQKAKCVIFPSYYEGFGIPLIEAQSHKKYVFVRDSSINNELLDHTGNTMTIFYHSTADLIQQLQDGFLVRYPTTSKSIVELHADGWDRAGNELLQLVTNTIASFDRARVLIPRLETISQAFGTIGFVEQKVPLVEALVRIRKRIFPIGSFRERLYLRLHSMIVRAR